MQELYANIPAPSCSSTLLPALAASMAFPIQSIFILLIFKLLNLFTILDSSGLFFLVLQAEQVLLCFESSATYVKYVAFR
jgi:hypothetical protein